MKVLTAFLGVALLSLILPPVALAQECNCPTPHDNTVECHSHNCFGETDEGDCESPTTQCFACAENTTTCCGQDFPYTYQGMSWIVSPSSACVMPPKALGRRLLLFYPGRNTVAAVLILPWRQEAAPPVPGRGERRVDRGHRESGGVL